MSVNNQNTIERSPAIDRFIHNTFQVCNTKQSSWTMEGTGEGTGIPAQHMHTSNIMFLEIMSRLYLGKDKGYMPTQYVPGASTHYVQDYWEDTKGVPVFEKLTPEQGKEKKYTFHPGLLAIYGKEGLREQEGIAKRMGICFEKGRLNLAKYGDDPVLRAFVMEHEQNKMAPNSAENKDPRRLKLFMFEPLIKENKAAKEKVVETWDESVEAIKFVDKLRTKTDKGYIYNEDSMDAILTILQDGIGLGKDEPIQKFKLIANKAKADGATFMKLVNGIMDEYRSSIGVAAQLNVLEYGATESKITVDAKKRVVATYKADTSKEDIIDTLVLYFLGTAKGKNDYKDLRRATESAKIAALNKK